MERSTFMVDRRGPAELRSAYYAAYAMERSTFMVDRRGLAELRSACYIDRRGLTRPRLLK